MFKVVLLFSLAVIVTYCVGLPLTDTLDKSIEDTCVSEKTGSRNEGVILGAGDKTDDETQRENDNAAVVKRSVKDKFHASSSQDDSSSVDSDSDTSSVDSDTSSSFSSSSSSSSDDDDDGHSPLGHARRNLAKTLAHIRKVLASL